MIILISNYRFLSGPLVFELFINLTESNSRAARDSKIPFDLCSGVNIGTYFEIILDRWRCALRTLASLARITAVFIVRSD